MFASATLENVPTADQVAVVVVACVAAACEITKTGNLKKYDCLLICIIYEYIYHKGYKAIAIR